MTSNTDEILPGLKYGVPLEVPIGFALQRTYEAAIAKDLVDVCLIPGDNAVLITKLGTEHYGNVTVECTIRIIQCHDA